MIRSFLIPQLIAICVVLLVGCSNSSSPTGLKSPISTSQYQESLGSPLPTSTPSVTSAFVLPTPSSKDLATVGGRFIRDIADNGNEPSVGTKLQLAHVIRSEDGTPLVASAGEKSSPTTFTEEEGFFVFEDVSPNTYALVVITPIDSFLIKNKMDKALLINIEPGKIVDLGEVHTDIPY